MIELLHLIIFFSSWNKFLKNILILVGINDDVYLLITNKDYDIKEQLVFKYYIIKITYQKCFKSTR